MILYDCEAEALSSSIRPRQSYSLMIKWSSTDSDQSKPVSFFMIKTRVCPSQNQFSPVQSRHSA
ncbi:hypothetical protein YC2023_041003 [Brassica napus]